MKYAQFNQVEEGDLVELFNGVPFDVYKKDELSVRTFDNRLISYQTITGLYKLDSNGNYMKVEVER